MQGRGAQGAGNMPGVSGCKDVARNDTSPTVIARSEATWQSVLLAVAQNRKAILWANTESVTNLPKQQPTCPVSLRRRGLPHQCAHWFAMTCRNLPGVCGCKNVVHNDMLKTGTRLRMHGRGARWHLPHCHCKERSGNPFSLRGCLYTRQPLWGLNYSLEGQHQQNAGGQHHRGAQPYPHHRLALLGLGRIQETYPPQAHDHRLVQQQGHRAVDAPLE